MPPKKKAGGKGKKKGSAKEGSGKAASGKKSKTPPSKPSDAAEAKDRPVDILTRQYYLIQIQDLEERVTRYRDRSDMTEIRNKDLEQRLATETKDKFDVTLTLKRQAGELTDANAELHEKMAELRGQHSLERDDLEHQIQAGKSQLKDQREELTGEINILKAELRKVETFRKMQDELEVKTRRLEVQLENEHAEFIRYRKEKDKSMVLLQERLKKELSTKLNATAAEFYKVSEQRMTETTKRAIQENSHVLERLGTMTKDMASSRDRSKALKEDLERASMEKDMLEKTNKEILTRKISNDKLIQVLVHKLQDQTDKIQEAEELRHTVDQLKEELEEIEAERTLLEQEAEKSSARIEIQDNNLSALQEQHDMLKADHSETRKILSSLSSLLMGRVASTNLTGDDEARIEADVMSQMFEVLRLATDSGVIDAEPKAPSAALGDSSFTRPQRTW